MKFLNVQIIAIFNVKIGILFSAKAKINMIQAVSRENGEIFPLNILHLNFQCNEVFITSSFAFVLWENFPFFVVPEEQKNCISHLKFPSPFSTNDA